MKITLIAGGAGFIGTNLCNSLINNSNDIIYCVDDLCTGVKRNIDAFSQNPRFKFFNYSIENIKDIGHIDRIINLACPASPLFYQKHPVKTLDTCFNGTRNLLDLAKRYNATMLQASTSEIYGDPLVNPQCECYNGNVNPIGVRACYDEGKRIAETLCYEYRRQYGLDVKIIRIFNTYGPYMRCDDGRIVSTFINQALKNEVLTVYGDGCQTRSFCYITDLVEAIRLILDSNVDTPVNIGNPEERSVLSIVSVLEDILGKKLNYKIYPAVEDDPRQRRPDISKATKLLGWRPKISFYEGMKLTCNYYKSILNDKKVKL